MVCDVRWAVIVQGELRLEFEILDSISRCLGIEEEIMGGLMPCFAGHWTRRDIWLFDTHVEVQKTIGCLVVCACDFCSGWSI